MSQISPAPAGQSAQGGPDFDDGGTFSALKRYPAYRSLWSGSVLAQIAQWMQSVALGWIALELSDSAFFVGIVSFVAGIPFLVVGLPAAVKRSLPEEDTLAAHRASAAHYAANAERFRRGLSRKDGEHGGD